MRALVDLELHVRRKWRRDQGGQAIGVSVPRSRAREQERQCSYDTNMEGGRPPPGLVRGALRVNLENAHARLIP
jgi:hypothetical protein